jgi:hypothetical protein
VNVARGHIHEELISVKSRRLSPGGTRGQRWAGLLFLVGCAVCGCGSPASPGAPVAISPSSFAILMTSRTAAVMESAPANAVQTMIQRCMRARHFAYFPVPESAASLDDGAVQVPELPAYGSLAQRRMHGYGLYSAGLRASRMRQKGETSRGSDAAAARNDAYVASLSATAQASYGTTEFGPASDVLTVALPGGAQAQVRAGGCRAAAVRRIYGSVVSYIQAVEGAPLLTDQLIAKVEADPAFAAAVHAWSRCMAARGLRYQSPNAAYNSLSDEYGAHGPSAGLRHREIAVAVADFRCAQAVSLLRITAALQHEEAGRLGAGPEAQLRLITRTVAQAARRARRAR